MNTTNDERRVVILRRLEQMRERIKDAAEPYQQLIGGSNEHEHHREELRRELAEIADELGKACD